MKIPWGVLESKLAATALYLQAEHHRRSPSASQLEGCVVGFCWGAMVVARLLGASMESLPIPIRCGVAFHPSLLIDEANRELMAHREVFQATGHTTLTSVQWNQCAHALCDKQALRAQPRWCAVPVS